ncbi:hypothetical protein GCM10008171_32560 [Methylopila jiangsuensis]|uniref:Uncharacterized protein n=1 Tax=Methylopila jiangsuensis TaxID=586230 RepID=A0A9W6JIU0_9HYPH|nr:hypothetical protein [Methylopila jiangsuensis]MDR6284607.1 hypothetical protein [Methylopila jiangsuensis]GLK78002.1 hypothetical protein GCM10008171_32560 [Methylopila jiangsuensis]
MTPARQAPDIVDVLRAAAVIPDEIQPVEFRQLLFDAAAAIEGLRTSVERHEGASVRDAKTIDDLRDIIAAYRATIALSAEPPAGNG